MGDSPPSAEYRRCVVEVIYVLKHGLCDLLTGIAIWASVSEDVDAKIREQIKAGSLSYSFTAG